jgi:arylsulfatase A-like enzyme
VERVLTRKGFLRAAGAGTAGAALLGSSAFITSCGRAELSPKPPDNPPGSSVTNIILIILDSLRKDHVGAYGSDLITPTLDALAEEGLRFTRAYPDAMPTIPARRAIHTGMRTLPFKVRWAPIPEEQTTLAEILKKEGYNTTLVTDTYHQFRMNFGRGFDAYRKIRGQERDPYKDPSSISEEEMRQRYLIFGKGRKARQYLANIKGQRKSEEDWFAPKVFINAMEALEETRRGEPFFLVADCYDPHEPWDPPEKYISLYDPGGYEGKDPLHPRYGKDDYLTNRQLLRMRALYAAEVTMADRWLGNFLEKAHDLGVMESTLLLVLSDHGHALGEHGYTGKPGYALWPELTDIVFLIRHPAGKGAGEVSDYYASTHDVAPTILGALGIKPPEPMEGQDLSVLLDGKEPDSRSHLTSGYGTHVWARDEQYVMFCRNDKAGAKLYDARNDPGQTRDLASDDPETVERMFEEYVLKDAGGSLPTH